jgi:hypothetical protein
MLGAHGRDASTLPHAERGGAYAETTAADVVEAANRKLELIFENQSKYTILFVNSDCKIRQKNIHAMRGTEAAQLAF